MVGKELCSNEVRTETVLREMCLKGAGMQLPCISQVSVFVSIDFSIDALCTACTVESACCPHLLHFPLTQSTSTSCS